MFILKLSKTTAISMLALSLSLTTAPNNAQAESNPYIGEIVPMGIYGFCPRGYAATNGDLLAISQFSALFSLLGTMYGGDGRTTFGLPDLESRIPVGQGSGPGLSHVSIGQRIGNESTTLTEANLASHNHRVNGNNADGNKAGPGGKVLAAAPPDGTGDETIYSVQSSTVLMSESMIGSTGSNISFSHLDPTSVIRYCIAIEGIYPSRS